MSVYYNELDPFAAAWLRELIKAKLIPAGDVDQRDIKQVQEDDLRGYTQCHFFAGIGGWAYALQLAGWPTDRPVWTGSCPCQPFSTAGKKASQSDERHLWPYWYRLIKECRPATIFGEQVASAIAHGWWDDVAADLEKENYACAAAVLPACSVGSPHKRERLWFMADAQSQRKWREERNIHQKNGRQNGECVQQFKRPDEGALGDPKYDGLTTAPISRSQREAIQYNEKRKNSASESERTGDSQYVAYTDSDGSQGSQDRQREEQFRGDCEFIECPDGKLRPVKPGVRLLAHGIPNRVGTLRGFGNAIVPEVAAKFIIASMETLL